MQTDPILFVRLLRQCNAAADSAEHLLHWLKQASLFCCQIHGDSVVAPLVRCLIAEFDPILKTLTTLGGEQVQQAACQQLFSQICLFYRDLNRYCDHTGPLQQWQLPVAECAAAHDLNGPAHDKADSSKHGAWHGAQRYNRYD